MIKPTAQQHEWRAAREAKLADLSARLEQAVTELVTGDDWLRALDFAVRFRSRSFANTLLIYRQHAQAHAQGRVPTPTPTYVAGFWDWKRLGRSVIKGQSGYMIRRPVTARYATATPSDPGSWRRLRRNEEPLPGEQVRTTMTGVRPGYVWDVAQTDGPPLPEPPQPVMLTGQTPPGLWNGLVAQVAERGFRLFDAPNAYELGGANGLIDFADKTVTVRADLPDAARLKTLAHELGHIVLDHHIRGEQGLSRGLKEVEAESVAAVITGAYGMDTSGYTVPYVADWATDIGDRDPVEAIRSTVERVRKTALAILDELPDPPTGDGAPPALAARPERGQERYSVSALHPSSTADLSFG